MSAKKNTLAQPSPPSSSYDESESDEEPQIPLVNKKPTIASTGKSVKPPPQPSPPSSSSYYSESEEEPQVTRKPTIASTGKTAYTKTPPQPSQSFSSSYESESDEEQQVTEMTQEPTDASAGKSGTKQPLTPTSSSSEEDSDEETEEDDEKEPHVPVPVPAKKEATLTREEPTLQQKEQVSAEKEPTLARKEITSTSNVTPLTNNEVSESESEPEEERSTPKTTPTVSKKRKIDTEKDKEPFSAGKKLFQRLWTEEDEVNLIKMLIKYRKKYGKLPSTPTENGVFHELVRNSLHVNFSRKQLLKKIRAVRSKYYSHLEKTDNGKINLQKEHDKVCFELSRKAWGDVDAKKVEKADDVCGKEGKDVIKSSTDRKRKAKSVAEDPQHNEASPEEGQGVHGKFLLLALDEMMTVLPIISKVSQKSLIKEAIENLDVKEVRSLEDEWKSLNVSQLVLTNKRFVLLNKILSVITSKLGP